MSLWVYEVCSDIAYLFINIYMRIVSPHVRIGRGARVNLRAVFEGYNKVERGSIFAGEMGRYSYVGANSLIIGKVGRFCSIAGNVSFLTLTHPIKDNISTHPVFFSNKKQSGRSFTKENLFNESPVKEGHDYSIEVGNDVYIGYGATIIGPLTIGNGAVIGAGSVVTKDVPPYAIVVGNPAKIKRYRFEKEQIDYLEKTKWWDKDDDWLEAHVDQFMNFDSFKNSFRE